MLKITVTKENDNFAARFKNQTAYGKTVQSALASLATTVNLDGELNYAIKAADRESYSADRASTLSNRHKKC